MRQKMKGKRKLLFLIPVALLFIISAIVMWLWNSCLIDATGLNAITYWQAMGILVLSKILFGGFHGFRKRGEHMRKKKFFDKMKNMTPEEQQRFKEMWKQRFDKQGFCKH